MAETEEVLEQAMLPMDIMQVWELELPPSWPVVATLPLAGLSARPLKLCKTYDCTLYHCSSGGIGR
jgi:hypothetical protein